MMDLEYDNLKQFRLVDGDEIVCEVLEDLEDDLVVRYALKISKIDISFNRSYYIFRNWMTFQEESTDTLVLSKFHIVGAANPSPKLLKEYYSALEALIEDEENSDVSTEDALRDFLEKMGLARTRSHTEGDSDFSNVISFVDRTKLH